MRIPLTLIVVVLATTPAIADPTDFDSSSCRAAFAAGDYSAAVKDCRAAAEATLDKVKKSRLTGDSRADALGIAAIQFQLTAIAQARDGVTSDAARAAHSLDEAQSLIQAALRSCKSAKCHTTMQQEAGRIELSRDFTS